MLPALAMADAGHDLTDDAYDIPGTRYTRKAVKILMLCMLNTKQRIRSWPDGVSKLFPEGTRLTDARNAIESAHPALAGRWYQDRGVKYMNTESNILVSTLMFLLKQNVPALPVHDCVLVPESGVEIAQEFMLRSFQFHTGHAGRVSISRP